MKHKIKIIISMDCETYSRFKEKFEKKHFIINEKANKSYFNSNLKL